MMISAVITALMHRLTNLISELSASQRALIMMSISLALFSVVRGEPAGWAVRKGECCPLS